MQLPLNFSNTTFFFHRPATWCCPLGRHDGRVERNGQSRRVQKSLPGNGVSFGDGRLPERRLFPELRCARLAACTQSYRLNRIRVNVSIGSPLAVAISANRSPMTLVLPLSTVHAGCAGIAARLLQPDRDGSPLTWTNSFIAGELTRKI